MVVMSVSVGMAVVRAVVMVVFEEQRADDIHGQSEARHDNGFVKMNRKGMQQSVDRFARHEQRNDSQNDGAGERAQDSHFAGAETVARVFGVAPGKGVGAHSDEKRGDMRS